MKELIELFAEKVGRYPRGNVQDELRSWAANEITTLRQRLDEKTRQATRWASECEDLRQQLAKSEARGAELIHSRQIEKTSMLMRVSRLSETLEAIRSGEFSLPKCQQLADRALGSPVTEAAILRLQAEAVEAAVRELMPGSSGAPDDPSPELNAACEVCADFRDYAQRLRQQADEAERAGGER